MSILLVELYTPQTVNSIPNKENIITVFDNGLELLPTPYMLLNLPAISYRSLTSFAHSSEQTNPRPVSVAQVGHTALLHALHMPTESISLCL